MKNLNRVLIAIVALALCSSAWARELRLPPGKWWENDKVVESVGLSDEQQARIHDLVFDHALRMIDFKGNVERRQLELAKVVESTDFDPSAVRKAFQAMQEARQKLEAEHFELVIAVRQELSQEQWQKLQRLHQDFKRSRASGEGPGPDRPGAGRPGGNRPQRPR